MNPGHSDGNRNARVTRRIQEALGNDGKVSFFEMTSIQSDEKLHDAEVLTPYITAALEAAQTPGAPPALAALGADPEGAGGGRPARGLEVLDAHRDPEGYDASDFYGIRYPPTQAEIDASVATTIYSLWRGRGARLDRRRPAGRARARRASSRRRPGDDRPAAPARPRTAPARRGSCSSPARPDATRRCCRSLKGALDLAASPAFAPAFGGSTNLADYRWGKLHRIVFRHPLGGPFSIPTGAGFTDLGAGLPGIASDGGFSAVDASSHNPRASTLNGFMFGSGPARRFVAEARRNHPLAVQVIPGGESGNPSGRWFGNQLGLWLTGEYHEATTRRSEIDVSQRQELVPAP